MRSFEQERRDDRPSPSAGPGPTAFALTAPQTLAIDAIAAAIRERRYFPALLQGVTGSGKTEVYLRAIRTALDAGRGAIWLVPEISLTPVFARELRRQFPERAAVLHSALSERERAEAWDRVRAGEALAVIGPRSAAFAPVEDPGLFIVDEEHDTSYKQRESPRYDAREVVALRARENGAALVFGSATPSVEAFHAAERGRVTRLTLPERIASRPLPSVTIVDLRRETARPEEKGVPLFSRPLVERLQEVFARGEQAILLQPRRGFAPFLLCRDCGHDFRCSRCSVARTVHERGQRARVSLLRGARAAARALPRVRRRTARGDRRRHRARGRPVRRSSSRVWRSVVLDRDTARRRGAAAVIEEFQSGRASCLIGTQMVAKGHDFPGVTAVGVLSADTLLHFPDFRSAEKTFQLLAQVAGRAGRGDSPGTVHVQTFHPSHPADRARGPARRRRPSHGRSSSSVAHSSTRRSASSPRSSLRPPTATGPRPRRAASEKRSARAAASCGSRARRRLPLERLQGRWRFQILVRAADRRAVLAALEAAVPDRAPAGTQLAVDVDPQDLM